MKKLNGLAKLLIVCAGVFIIGLAMTIGGAIGGGVNGLNKVADKYEWFSAMPGPSTIERAEVSDFNSIDFNGCADVTIVGPEYWNEVNDELDVKVGSVDPEAGDVYFVYGENITPPTATVKEGVLKINAYDEEGKIQMNLSSEDASARVYIFCGDDELESLNVDCDYRNCEIKGISFKSGEIKMDAGELETELLTSKGLKVSSTLSDIELSGDFTGTTEITGNSGDISFETGIDTDKYNMDIEAVNGEIEIGDGDVEIDDYPYTYVRQGGPNELIIKNENGDVDIWFGDTMF